MLVERADIFRRQGPASRAHVGDRRLPSPRRALHDSARCRTAALGGQLSAGQQWGDAHYSYHSWKNRHCPTCQNDQAEAWLEHQQSVLLPVPSFMVTFTLPEARRAIARSHQQTLYTLLFRASSEA